jgi:hypothetical protein
MLKPEVMPGQAWALVALRSPSAGLNQQWGSNRLQPLLLLFMR